MLRPALARARRRARWLPRRQAVVAARRDLKRRSGRNRRLRRLDWPAAGPERDDGLEAVCVVDRTTPDDDPGMPCDCGPVAPSADDQSRLRPRLGEIPVDNEAPLEAVAPEK